ncbi:hypothetical protein DLAC_04963 [Tieghemostelium lacteum]|uniref:Uncharacterized protein n=1 Tax=Tieghemostelium lacteum TaxID=361077 RepID=A0A151ZI89_TIELA|nr:hypothetical protein DLAC_04963 [Tieghemostelium lacteum]|eukprot:KYQ93590.1 hypothetical protein DLAC_04963 [Tieghemostelium lacteum]
MTCTCSSGNSLSCGWNSGCSCAEMSMDYTDDISLGESPEIFESEEMAPGDDDDDDGDEAPDEGIWGGDFKINLEMDNQPPPNFICSIDGTGGKGSFVFQGFIGFDQTVTCTKYASGTITSHAWAVHDGCKNGGSLVVTANMINFSCKCTKFNGCSRVSNILYYTF